MSDNTNIGSAVKSLKSSDPIGTITKVVIVVNDDGDYFEAGNDTGRTLELTCPWGNEAMAQNILNGIGDLNYHPYEADGAIFNPAVELGDPVSVGDVNSGVYSQTIQFGHLSSSQISAPFDEEIDHEFPYKPASERRYTRQLKSVRAELTVQANKIEAKVEKTGGNEDESFSWTLESNGWTVKANGNTVFKINKNGAEVTGKIVATSGEIGGCEIKNGVLRVANANFTGATIKNANIESLNASKITAGYLSVDRIQDNSIKGDQKLWPTSVGGNSIMGGAISYGKTDVGVQGSLTAAGNAWSGVQAINNQLVNILYANTIQINGNLFVKWGDRYLTFRPMAYSLDTARYLFASSDA